MDQRRRERSEEAAARKAIRDGLTPKQQMKELDIREGVGKGAKKERARLQAKIDGVVPHQEESKKVKVAEVEVSAEDKEKLEYMKQRYKKGKSGK